MDYGNFLKKNGDKNNCPFCTPKASFIIKENKFAYLTPARAPYLKDHLLVIPKRHVMTLDALKGFEKEAIFDLLISSMDLLKKEYPGINMEYREGDIKASKKSVPHVHFHVIPRRRWSKPNETALRKFLSEGSLIKEVKRIKNFYG